MYFEPYNWRAISEKDLIDSGSPIYKPKRSMSIKTKRRRKKGKKK